MIGKGIVSIDKVSESQISIDSNHHEIHEGVHFFYVDYFSVAGSGVLNFTLMTGDKDIHFVFSVGSDTAGFILETYRSVVANNDGTIIDLINNNENSLNVSSVVCRQNPTGIVTTSAKRLRRTKSGEGGAPSSRIGGSISRSDEVVLRKNTKYLIRITNLSTTSNDINLGIGEYET